MKYTIIATATFGVEAIVGTELRDLGYEVTVHNGYASFEGTLEDMVRANLWLRTAERVFIELAQFEARSFEELYQGVRQIEWERFIENDGAFPVNAKSVKSTLFSLSDIQSIAKKATVDRLAKLRETDWLDESGPTYPILISILKDRVSVLLDTSLTGLHKRGYRLQQKEAPLKETLAAAMLKIARWKPAIPLIDPLCGSGTIPIEAAMMGLSIAPGLGRTFAFDDWAFVSDDMIQRVRQEAASMRRDLPLQIFGYDRDPGSIEAAKENAMKAGVSEYVHFETADVAELSSDLEYGYIIANPPYGERLSDRRSVESLYGRMGDRFEALDTWSKYVLTSHEGFESAYGKKATKNRKLYNGNIKCYYYQYYGPRPPKKVIDHALATEE